MMDLFDDINRQECEEILTLRRELEEANRRYYVESAPTMSDRDFDFKMHRLEDLEKAHPEMADPNSPTQMWVQTSVIPVYKEQQAVQRHLNKCDTATRCCR